MICHTSTFDMGFPGSSAGKESTCNVGDLGSILGLGKSPGRSPGRMYGNLLWYSYKEMKKSYDFLPGKSPWMEEPDGLQSMGS